MRARPNSIPEDLIAKVEVAGSKPVSRSPLYFVSNLNWIGAALNGHEDAMSQCS